MYPHGSSDSLPYAAMGSGSLAAIAVLESEFKELMSLQTAKELTAKAILAGIMNDLGSGSYVDLCVITEGKTEYLRNYKCEVNRMFRGKQYYNFADEITSTNTSNLTTATRT